MNKYTIGYAKSLVAATPQAQLAEGYKPKSVKGLSSEQVALMERESANLEREFRIVEQSYGTDHLVCLAQIARASMPDDLVDHGACQRIS